MKSKKRTVITPDFENLIPLLIDHWRRLHKIPGGPPDVLQTREFRSVVSNVQIIESGSLKNEDYFANKDILGAYLLYQWILHYSQGLSLIGELPFTPYRVLDICSGPGAFAYSALRHGASDVWAIDRNQNALELGASICGRSGYPLSVRSWKDKEKLPVEGQFDLIILGYALEELYPQEINTSFIKGLLERLTPQGVLLIVESSWNHSNKRILNLREKLIGNGVKILAPCINQGSCPMLQVANGTCYTQREFDKPYIIKEIQRAAQINLSSLKMSYLMLRHPQAADRPETDELYRVISPPVDTARGKRYFLCGKEGKKMLGSLLEEHPAFSRAFEFLKRGDAVSIENHLINKDHFEIIENTILKVEAAVGKPLIKT